MRIIGGLAKGRTLKTPRSGTRPMTGRARESVFSILGSRLASARVLDLYAGSGSLGLEALSRGAAEAVFVERSRRAVEVLEGNIEAVGLGGDVVAGDVATVLPTLTGPFDVVFVDPPYADDAEAVRHVLDLVGPVLAGEGLIVVHRQAASPLVVPEFLTSVDQRRYGDAVVTMLERLAE